MVVIEVAAVVRPELFIRARYSTFEPTFSTLHQYRGPQDHAKCKFRPYSLISDVCLEEVVRRWNDWFTFGRSYLRA